MVPLSISLFYIINFFSFTELITDTLKKEKKIKNALVIRYMFSYLCMLAVDTIQDSKTEN